VTTNSLRHDGLPAQVEQLTVAPLLADAIKKIHAGSSLSTLFDGTRPAGSR